LPGPANADARVATPSQARARRAASWQPHLPHPLLERDEVRALGDLVVGGRAPARRRRGRSDRPAAGLACAARASAVAGLAAGAGVAAGARFARVSGLVAFAAEAGFVRFAVGVAGSLDLAARSAGGAGLVAFAAEVRVVRFADVAGLAGSLDVAAARLARVAGLVGSAAVAAVARFASVAGLAGFCVIDLLRLLGRRRRGRRSFCLCIQVTCVAWTRPFIGSHDADVKSKRTSAALQVPRAAAITTRSSHDRGQLEQARHQLVSRATKRLRDYSKIPRSATDNEPELLARRPDA